ncbi:hypothetical protein HPB50_005866 [Hyalomma asiaticum]|uniref:Uncharacterized protein n=1 Tax=Hyalomma asiaticum TaxID=266040 RepID=A0ACB7S7P7_HYAAI|nr:hypothetical protein HPB50_005866 [Hyalomma asiaticum]
MQFDTFDLAVMGLCLRADVRIFAAPVMPEAFHTRPRRGTHTTLAYTLLTVLQAPNGRACAPLRFLAHPSMQTRDRRRTLKPVHLARKYREQRRCGKRWQRLLFRFRTRKPLAAQKANYRHGRTRRPLSFSASDHI